MTCSIPVDVESVAAEDKCHVVVTEDEDAKMEKVATCLRHGFREYCC